MSKIIPAPNAALKPIHEQAPDFLRQGESQSTDLLKQYVVPPRLKIVQKMAKEPFASKFKYGDVVAVPMLQPVAEFKKSGDPIFHFVPLLFYPEWCAWNPIDARGALPTIKDRTLDPANPIAVKSRDPATRNEKCLEMPKKDGKDLFVRNLEHLNYIIVIVGDHPMADLPILMSFASGEHKSGTNFNALIQQRRVKHLCGCVFEATIGDRDNGKGQWRGLDINNPSVEGVAPFVQDAATFDRYRGIHEEYLAIYQNKLIRADYDEDVDPVAAPADSKEF